MKKAGFQHIGCDVIMDIWLCKALALISTIFPGGHEGSERWCPDVCVCGDQIRYIMIMNTEWRVATLIKKERKATKLDSCSTTSDVAGVVTVRCEFSRNLSKPHPDRYRGFHSQSTSFFCASWWLYQSGVTVKNVNKQHTNHMSLSNGRRRGLGSSGPMKREIMSRGRWRRPGVLVRRWGPGCVRARDEGVGERNTAVENRAVTRDGPGDDVSAVVRARAGVLAEI